MPDSIINDENLRKGRAGTLADWTKTKTADTSSENAMAGERAPNTRHSVGRIFSAFSRQILAALSANFKFEMGVDFFFSAPRTDTKFALHPSRGKSEENDEAGIGEYCRTDP